MRFLLFTFAVFTYSFNVHCKQAPEISLKEEHQAELPAIKARPLFTLDQKLAETSGLIFFDNSFWTINDSGNSNTLYKIDSASGSVLAEVRINNSANVDWEELTQDQSYVFIADIGDNSLARNEKQIYRVRKSDLLNVKSGDSVNSDVIRFTYPQSDGKDSRFDAEAMVAYKGSLHLFTKDLFETNHFIITPETGKSTAKFVGRFKSNGQVTGAAVDSTANTLVMVGYLGFGERLLWEFKEINTSSFFNSVRFFTMGPVNETGQVEAVCFSPGKNLFFSNEDFGAVRQQLWSLPYPLK